MEHDEGTKDTMHYFNGDSMESYGETMHVQRTSPMGPDACTEDNSYWMKTYMVTQCMHKGQIPLGTQCIHE